MAPTGINHLSTELICLILLEDLSFQDLGSFIQTCRHVYKAFMELRPSILSELAKRTTVVEMFLDAEASIRCSESSRPIEHRGQQGRYSFIYNFTRYSHAETRLERPDVVIPKFISMPGSLAICKLESLVPYFVQDFSAHALSHIRTLNIDLDSPAACKDEFRRLSPVEKARLERAFCRYGTLQQDMYGKNSMREPREQKDLGCLAGEYFNITHYYQP
jgi:endonuclease I